MGETAGSDPLIGRVFDGRYRVDALIGAGGMGTIYRACQLSIDRPVALKVIHTQAAHDPDAVRRFEVEARVISRLRHPNTMSLIDFGRDADGRLYLVCELLHGATLDATLAQGPMAPGQVAALIRQVAGALAEAHAAGVVHRDLKPSNLFIEQVDTQEIVKILDFGIAKLSDGGVRTASGRIFGTPRYMSPEQAEGQPVDPRSDLYSLGVVAYECLCGRPPFDGSTAYSLLMKQVHDPPPPIDVDETVPALEALILELLSKDPADRPISARVVAQRAQLLMGADVIAGSRPALASSPGAGSDPQATETWGSEPRAVLSTPPPPSPPRRLSALLLLVALALVAAVIWGFAGTPPAGEAGALRVVDAALIVVAARPDAARPDAARPDAARPDAALPIDGGPAPAMDAAGPPEPVKAPSPRLRRSVERAELILTPRRPTYRPGKEPRLVARALDRKGRALKRTPRWTVSPAGIARIIDGRLVASGAGRVQIEVCFDEVCAQTSVLFLSARVP